MIRFSVEEEALLKLDPILTCQFEDFKICLAGEWVLKPPLVIPQG